MSEFEAIERPTTNRPRQQDISAVWRQWMLILTAWMAFLMTVVFCFTTYKYFQLQMAMNEAGRTMERDLRKIGK